MIEITVGRERGHSGTCSGSPGGCQFKSGQDGLFRRRSELGQNHLRGRVCWYTSLSIRVCLFLEDLPS